MGRETKTFRQTKRSGGADSSAKNYSQVNRQGPWNKVVNYFKKNKETQNG